MPSNTPPLGKKLYTRLTASLPLMVTVIVHVLLVAVAGYFVVSEQIIGKKKNFEASAAAENVVQKQVEHRLQVARKGSGSASSSPVSANRIFSTASNGLTLPAMPDLPSVGAFAPTGTGFGSGAGGVGADTGYSTGRGTGAALGSGFMSMSFLGTTSQRASKVVFVIEVGPKILDIRKGGVEACKIIREEIMKLISRLSPSTEFGVVLFDSDAFLGGMVSPFEPKLLPATSVNKTRFFEWIKPLNTDTEKLGLKGVERVSWTPRPLPNAGLDSDLTVSLWLRALRCGLEMGPDTIYAITTEAGRGEAKVSEAELTKRKQAYEQKLAEFKRTGMDAKAIIAARAASEAKAQAQLNEINDKLKAKGKPPFVIQHINRIWEADFQAALRQQGFSIQRDLTGWTTKEGKKIEVPWMHDQTDVEYPEILLYVSQLQRALLKERAALNIFLFVGPAENPKDSMEKLGKLAARNGGRCNLSPLKNSKNWRPRTRVRNNGLGRNRKIDF
jgi:hypothetical protein